MLDILSADLRRGMVDKLYLRHIHTEEEKIDTWPALQSLLQEGNVAKLSEYLDSSRLDVRSVRFTVRLVN